jgi:GNAT superfamily N-acetyltransferase
VPRRILTAREQYDMAEPWRRQAGIQVEPDPTGSNGGNAVHAWHGDKLVGNLTWNGDPPEVQYVSTHPDYRHQGIATHMINWARQNKEPNLDFNDWLSPSGHGLATSMGYTPKDWSPEQADTSDEDDSEWEPGGRFDKTRQDIAEDTQRNQQYSERMKRLKPGQTPRDLELEDARRREARPLYRGVTVPHDSWPASYEGDQMLDWIASNHPDSDVGLGRHWSTDRSVAERSTHNNGHSLVMETDWGGNGEDHDRTNTRPPAPGRQWDDEHEVTIRPGTSLPINSLQKRNDTGGWDETLPEGWRGVEHEASRLFPNKAQGSGWLNDDGWTDHPELYVHKPQFGTQNPEGQRGGGWLEGEPTEGPTDQRNWRQVKYDVDNSRFYHPDTNEPVGRYEWAHGRPDTTLHVS